MFLKHVKDCEELIAGDDSILRELLHPQREDVQIRYSLAHAKVPPGRATKPHRLKASEVYYIITGDGLMHIDKESFEVSPECTAYIPPNAIQYIENTSDSDLNFLCIVDPAWRKEDEEVFES
ncbi:MAG: cupin domain-containing protein [Planctomycetota bacterium]|jgi:mannose-6-phosphate isomerase-like protein (cupin superfamily)